MESNYQEFLKGKKITLMGLGLLGRGVGDARFFAEQGAREVLITDLKTKEELKESVEKLKDFENIKFVLGGHRLEDFKDRDMVIKSAGVPLENEYIEEAKKNNIPVYMSTALFAQFYPGTIVGVTGTRGKTTVTYLIYEVLRGAGKKVFLGGNVRGVSTIAHLPDSTVDEIAVLELDSWQLQGFGEQKISPPVSVFTTFMADHLNYYKGDLNRYLSDKANIFRFQKEDDVLVMGDKVAGILGNSIGFERIVSQKVITGSDDVPENWEIKIPGEHNRYNIACAIEVLRTLGISNEEIRQGVENFKGVEGRLELIKEVDGIRIYNDTTATTPDATLSGLKAVSKDKNTVLILGGTDKEIDPKNLIENINQYAKVIVLLPGTGTDKIVPKLVGHGVALEKSESLEEVLEKAKKHLNSGDVLLFSPGFASFGLFKNEYDRGDQFNNLVNKIWI